MEERAIAQMDRLGVTTLASVRTPVATLSEGNARRSQWPAPRCGTQTVILDEPTAALGVTQTALVLDLIRHLRAQGLAS